MSAEVPTPAGSTAIASALVELEAKEQGEGATTRAQAVAMEADQGLMRVGTSVLQLAV